MKYTPQQVIDALIELAPCPIVHELPPGFGNHRSSYWRKGKWQDGEFIYINEGKARHWNYATVLAHEVAHALDAHGLHPAQAAMKKSPQCRYRTELAAVAYEIAFLRQVGLNRKKSGKRWAKISTEYLNRYKQGKHPSLATVLKEIKQPVLELGQ